MAKHALRLLRPPRARPPRARALAAALAALALLSCGDEEGARPRPRRPAPPGGEEPRIGPYPRSQYFLERDLFLPADEPLTVPAAQAAFLRDDDEVYGLVIEGKARAYAVTMLSFHHVVNDVVGGVPVAVTY